MRDLPCSAPVPISYLPSSAPLLETFLTYPPPACLLRLVTRSEFCLIHPHHTHISTYTSLIIDATASRVWLDRLQQTSDCLQPDPALPIQPTIASASQQLTACDQKNRHSDTGAQWHTAAHTHTQHTRARVEDTSSHGLAQSRRREEQVLPMLRRRR